VTAPRVPLPAGDPRHGTTTGYSLGCKCDLCLTWSRDRTRRYRATHTSPPKTPLTADDLRHGTTTGYSHGCKCGPCRKAKLLDQRRYHAENRELVRAQRRRYMAENVNTREPMAANDPRHGKRSGYERGCRCPACKGWKLDYGRTLRAENMEFFQERDRRYYAENRAAKLEYQSGYNTENAKRIQERQDDYRAANQARWESEDPYSDPLPKRCAACRKNLSRSLFSTNPSAPDGLLGYCRSCDAARSSGRRATVFDQWVEYVDHAVVWDRDGGICYLCGLPADPDNWHLDHVKPLVLKGEHSYANTAVSHPVCNQRKGGRPWPGLVPKLDTET
jgi:hypothetical protein